MEIDGVTRVSLRGAWTNVRVTGFTITPNKSYSVRVVTIDENGNRSYSSTVTITTLEEPEQKPGSVVPYDLKIVSVNGGDVILTAKIDYIPDYEGYEAYTYGARTQLSYSSPWNNPNPTSSSITYLLAPTNTPKTYTFEITGAYPQNVAYWYIQVERADGSDVVQSEKVYYDYPGAPETNKPTAPTLKKVTSDLNDGRGRIFEYTKGTDDSGAVCYYRFTVTGPGGYSDERYERHYMSTGLSYWPKGFDDYASMASGAYTITAWSIDIWGNVSDPYVHEHTVP